MSLGAFWGKSAGSLYGILAHCVLLQESSLECVRYIKHQSVAIA